MLLIRSNQYDSYTLPGGGVELGETFAEAAIREANEEVGIKINIVSELGETMEIFDKPKILNITTGFFAEVEHEHGNLDLNSIEEDQELLWVPVSEALHLIEQTNERAPHTAMMREAYFIQRYLKYIR